MAAGRVLVTALLRLSLPLSVWIVGFCAVYALQGYGCSRHWPAGLDPRLFLIGAGGAFVLVQALAMLAVLARPSPSRFVQGVATALALTALVAAVWTMAPVLVIPACA
jgi:hypothetical protein